MEAKGGLQVMTPEIIIIAPVLILITIVLALILFSEGPGSNITAAVRVRVDDTRRRSIRSIRSLQREEEAAAKAREQDRNFLLILLLTIFAILFTYMISF